MADTLEDLLAVQAIRDVLARYCRGLDRMDRDLAASVWHPDATADYGSMFQGTGAGFVDWVWEAHAALERHSHQITNVLVDVDVDGETAVSEAYVTVVLWQRLEDGGVVEIVGRGRYADRWSRRRGRWAIDHRRYISDLQTMTELSGTQVDPAVEGRRDRSDPSYDVLG